MRIVAWGFGLALPWAVGCGEESPPPRAGEFSIEECPTQGLVEVARMPLDAAADSSWSIWERGLAVSGGRVFFMRSDSGEQNGKLETNDVVAAIPTGGGPSADVASAPNNGAGAAYFAVDGSTLYLVNDGRVVTAELSENLVTLRALVFRGLPEYNVMDSDSVYTAIVHWSERPLSPEKPSVLQVLQTPRDGGPTTVLFEEHRLGPSIGGIVDAGDSLLVSMGWSDEIAPGNFKLVGQIRRIPKDRAPSTVLRPDLQVNTAVDAWLGWDGTTVDADVYVDGPRGSSHQSRVPIPHGPPVKLRTSSSGSALRTSTGTLVVQKIYGGVAGEGRAALISTGRDGESVLACSVTERHDVQPMGIAADESDVYVAYRVGNFPDRTELVIAKRPD